MFVLFAQFAQNIARILGINRFVLISELIKNESVE